MTDLTELRMNVAALKRVDPYIKDILDTATHVALYTFNAENNEWEKTDIEGALFVYSRNGEPYNSILIMNRLNTNNLVEPVTLGLDLQLQEPFLLYRNSKGNIYGIWFYDKVECIRIAVMLNTLVKESELNRKTINNTVVKSGKKIAKPSMNNVDIFSMLSKAQEDFNTTRGGTGSDVKNGSTSKSPVGQSLHATITDNYGGPLLAPLGPDVTSQSVMDFFAKAKVNTGHLKAGDQPTAGNVVVVAAAAESKPLLARLMSHPAAHMLEHIEKQQRSTTPQPSGLLPVAGGHPPPTPPVVKPATGGVVSSSSSSVVTSNRSKKITNKTTLINHEESVVSALTSVSQQLQRQVTENGSEKNNDSSFLRIGSPSLNNTAASRNNNSETSDTTLSCNSLPLSSLFINDNPPMGCSELSGGRTLKNAGPALIPPVMFAAPSPSEPVNRPLEPLTRNQLLQAFNYLLRSDPDFINKLHEAYVKSFGEILS